MYTQVGACALQYPFSILHAGTVCTWCMPCAGDCMMFLLDLSLEDRVPFCSLVVVYTIFYLTKSRL